MNDYSPQSVFDETVRHLARQGGPSLRRGEKWTCMYRGPGGRRCAVGFWISDETYNSRMEKNPVSDAIGARIVQAGLPEPMRAPRILTILEQLQQVHDCEYNWDGSLDTWNVKALAEDLRRLCRRKRLRMAVIKECFP